MGWASNNNCDKAISFYYAKSNQMNKSYEIKCHEKPFIRYLKIAQTHKIHDKMNYKLINL